MFLHSSRPGGAGRTSLEASCRVCCFSCRLLPIGLRMLHTNTGSPFGMRLR